MKRLSLLPFLFLWVQPFHFPGPNFNMPDKAWGFIDPTGTYILKGNVKKNNITGHFGELRVQLLDSQSVAFCFYLSSGYPDYATAAILDTLRYTFNSIRYQPKIDSTCSLVLTFSARRAELMTVFSDPGSGCGFAPGIIAPATFQKISSEIPVIQDLSVRGRVTP